MYSFDDWAKVYDLEYDKYKTDIPFYLNEAKKSKGKVLEIATGTGRVYLPILKSGIDIYGFDISKKMLDELKEKAKKIGLKTKVKQADMRNFKYKEKFSTIIIPFRAFLHNITIEDQIATLKNVYNNLLPKGRLILNFFLPNWDWILKHYGKTETAKIKTKEGTITTLAKSEFLDEINQIVDVQYKFKKGSKIIMRNRFQLAFIYKREFELLLKLAGFKKWEVYGGFNYEPMKDRKQEMVWIIEK